MKRKSDHNINARSHLQGNDFGEKREIFVVFFLNLGRVKRERKRKRERQKCGMRRMYSEKTQAR